MSDFDIAWAPQENTVKTCRICKKELPATFEYFSRHTGTRDKLDQRCILCVRELRRQKQKEVLACKNGWEYLGALTEYIDLHDPDVTCKTWQGGKIPGSIFQTKHSSFAAAPPQGLRRNFDTREKAKEYLVAVAKSKGGLLNEYKIIEHKGKKYAIVRLSQDFCTLTDYESLDYIRKVNLCATKAGSEKAQHYCRAYANFVIAGYHNIITGFEMVDHWDRYPLDNRLENLRYTTHKDNAANTSNIGKTSVVVSDGMYEARITWTECKGRFASRDAFQKFPKTPEGKRDAIKWLDDMRIQVEDNALDGHGKDLALDFIDIMTAHADGLKWCDDITSEEKVKNIHGDVAPPPSSITPIHEKYELFKRIDPDFSYKKYSINAIDRAVRVLTHEGVMYKYCGTCKEWVHTDLFGRVNGAYSKRCKTCANSDEKNDATKVWKEKNKDAVSEYNIAYQAKRRAEAKKAAEDAGIKPGRKYISTETKYDMFREQVYTSFVNPPGKAVQNITHEGVEYKFCGMCELWLDMCKFNKATRACRECSKASLKKK